MSYERSPVKAPSSTGRRMMPPTPQQISQSLTDESQWQADLKAQRSIWSTRERRVTTGMEGYLDKSDGIKVEIEVLELLMDPEDSEACLRYILTHARRRGSRIFDIFSTEETIDHLVASRDRWLEYQGKKIDKQERWLSDLQNVNYERTMAKAPPCPERRMRTPLPQQSSSSTREEDRHWRAQERTRRKRKRCVAFEDAAKRMLRYLEDSEDLQVGFSELKEQ